MHRLFAFLLVITSKLSPTESHGRLIEPPSRASAWRYGFDTPHNYNDHELYCGGFTRQWVKNGGKCGVCGDPWDSKLPRAHEFGGAYGQGVIVRKYKKGQLINIRVELTANHFGYFEFSLCPNYRNASQECLDGNVLRLSRPQDGVEHVSTRYFPRDGNRVYEMKYRLPKMECAHCLLQWRYIAGNNWGNCPNGTGAVGCGPQEEFRACADVRIGDSSSESPDYNEIPEDGGAPTKPEQTSGPQYTPITSIIISLTSFLVISLILFLLYLHYYRVGSKVRVWVAENPWRFHGDKFKSQQAAPVAPPRGKRAKPSDGMYEINLKRDNVV